MNYKEKVVFVLGAGFSAPAKLPIQNGILQEMINKPVVDIMAYSPEPESKKFLFSFINVGLFLLENYTTLDCENLAKEFSNLEIKRKYAACINPSVLSSDQEYNTLLRMSEQIRTKLQTANVHVSLEDVFTSFDKTYQSREFFHKYSYQNTDTINESITRLFVYYFSKGCRAHKYNDANYLSFFKYLGNNPNASIISTNWDTLTEEYLNRLGIRYNLCLNEEYYHTEQKSKRKKKGLKEVNLVKLHGSINWFRCLNCGSINIVSSADCGNYLFDDNCKEHCINCKEKKDHEFLLQAQIITPTMMKSLKSQLYYNLWSAAGSLLRNAERVVFIGYSLPIADYDFRYMLQKAIPSYAKVDVVLYHDDNPNQSDNLHMKELLPENRYRALFAQNKLTFCYEGFGEFFKSEFPS
nr:SIR2 family protein [Clostridia bacterium]